MGIRIDGNNDLINAADGSLTVEGLSINVTGIVTASEGYKVGSAYTVFSNGNVATSGIITATGGTFTGDVNIADQIIHSGDTNTKIRFPAADTITAETGGSERLRITSAGLIGIGTDTPIEELHITASGYAGQVFQSARTTSTDNIGGPLWHDAGGNVKAKVQANVSGDLKFTSGGSSETARIDSSGRLLIGTTTEGHANADDFTVATSANTGITIRSGTSNGGNIFFSDATSGTGEYAGMISYDHGDNIMTFATNDGTEKVRITSGGNVGITTSAVNTSQDRALTIYGTNSSELQLKAGNFGGGASGQGASLTCSFGSFFITNNNPNGDIHFQTQKSGQSTSEKMRITESGIVGINTQSSNDTSELLCLLGPSGDNATIGIKNQNTTGAGIIGFHDHDATFRGRVQYNHSGDSMVFHTAAGERMRITSAGDILLNNTLGGAEAINMIGDGGGILISRSESGSPTDGQTLADLGLNSYASGQTCSSADVLIRGQADGDHSGSAAGSALLLFTKPSSTGPGSSPTERLRINKSGAIGIAGANYVSAGQVLTSNGSGSAVSWAAASGGKVLQVISATKTDTASNSTGSGASDVWNYNVSDLRVQITAANANNKFLIMGSVTTSSGASVHIIVRDNGTNLVGLQATGQSQRRQASSGHDQSDSHSASTVPIQGMITAGDTNQHTFHYAFNHTSGSTQDIFINRGTNDGNGSDRGRYVSTITVMEIEA